MERMRPSMLRLDTIAAFLALGILGIGAYIILKPFLIPVAWAGILTYAAWPLYDRLRLFLRGSDKIAASVMTVFIVVVVVVPFALISLSLADEVKYVYILIRDLIITPPDLPKWIKDIPWVGESIMERLTEFMQQPAIWQKWLPNDPSQIVNWILGVAGGVGRNMAKMGISLITIFFLFLYGDSVVWQLRKALDRITEKRGRSWMNTVGHTVSMVLYGMLLTAMAQGLFAGIGYWAVGIKAPAFLGACTGLMALIPFGPPFVWLPVAVWVFLHNSVWIGLGFFAWGLFAISGIDNIVKPLFISSSTRIPFLFVFFGVIGGLGAFGLIGIFLGPLLLSVLLALWQEWIKPKDADPIGPLKDS